MKYSRKRIQLYFPEDIVTFRQIMSWKNSAQSLSAKKRKQIADYLIIKKEVEHKWSSEDKKRFLRVKRVLAAQETVISSPDEVKV